MAQSRTAQRGSEQNSSVPLSTAQKKAQNKVAQNGSVSDTRFNCLTNAISLETEIAEGEGTVRTALYSCKQLKTGGFKKIKIIF